MEEINLKEFFTFCKKKIWLICLLVAISLGACAIYSFSIQKPDYKSYATVILNGGESSPITQSDITLNKSLIDTYAEIVKSRRVLDQVKSSLHLNTQYENLSNKISVSDVDKSQIIKISVTDSNPESAKEIANTTAEFFIKEITTLYNIDGVNILDSAIAPDSPYNINIPKQFLIFALVGFALGVIIIFAIFYFDTSVHNVEQVEDQVKLSVLGKVHLSSNVSKSNELAIIKNPKSLVSEDIRTIRTNLQLLMLKNKAKTFLITSSLPGEGKSFVSSNLALAFAQAGKRVLLIDCDLRLGRIREIFKIKTQHGLSDALKDPNVANKIIIKSPVRGLDIISRGAVPEQPSELLSKSAIFSKMLSSFKINYDYIILDGPPIQGLSDSLIISNIADFTALVCAGDHTDVSTLSSTRKMLNNVDAKIAGVIMNRVKEKTNNKYYDKYHNYYKGN